MAASSSTGRGIGPATHSYVAPARPQGNQIRIASFNIGAGQPLSYTSGAGNKLFSEKMQRDMAALIAVSHVICVQEVSATWAVFIAKLLPAGGMPPEWKLQMPKFMVGRAVGRTPPTHS